ncbi:leucine-rich repeat-containing protein 31 [Protopterus annectens]|uniref:leucine-rich repeat-containing protein 31 n=1 Tax=Protopterus annectens TaxID=7888 RepID=UPI001CFB839A|nr:leucine-rich repeat-containing protein 31 [Protopterus annectens]
MEAADSQQKREEGFQKRSPFEMIMNQIRRKKSFAERQHRSSVSRFFRSSEQDKSKTESIPEKNEGDEKASSETDGEDKENISRLSDEPQSPDFDQPSTKGWGRVKLFMERMGKKPSSKNLNLNNCSLTATDIIDLTTILPYLTALEELDLSWNDFIGGALKPLTLHLQYVNSLKILKLNNCRLTVDDITALGEAFVIIPNLEELDLSWNSYIGGNLSNLTQNVQAKCKIKQLRFLDCSLSGEDILLLGKTLHLVPELELLDLSLNKNIGSTIEILAQEMKHVPKLKSLKLHKCGITQDGIRLLGDAFQYFPELKKLDLSGNKEAGGGFKTAACHLAGLKELQSLDLHQCSLTHEDTAALTQVIPLITSLQVLNLSSNKNVGASSQHLCSRLRFLPKLKSIHLNNCGLNEDSYRALAESAPYLTVLDTLDLSWNKCIGGQLNILMEMLGAGTALQALKLSSCNLMAEDLEALASVCQSGYLAKLQKLDLMYNDTVDEVGWNSFFRDLNGLTELSEMDISLRPSARRECGSWFSSLTECLTRLPALKEFGMQRWILTASQRNSLEHFNKENKQNIQFEYYHSTRIDTQSPS